MVHMETQWPARGSRRVQETGVNAVRVCQSVLPEAIIIQQFAEKVPGF